MLNKIIYILIFILALIAALYLYGYFSKKHLKPLPTVENVDLSKYAGVWHEIALLPNNFEKGCICTKAKYTKKKNYIEVVNICYKNGKKDKIKGKAWAVNKSNSKLKVQFFWPFRGDYWILYIDKKYKYSLVGVPSRKYFWVLARDKKIPNYKYTQLITIAKNLGFDVEKIIPTQQTCN